MPTKDTTQHKQNASIWPSQISEEIKLSLQPVVITKSTELIITDKAKTTAARDEN